MDQSADQLWINRSVHRTASEYAGKLKIARSDFADRAELRLQYKAQFTVADSLNQRQVNDSWLNGSAAGVQLSSDKPVQDERVIFASEEELDGQDNIASRPQHFES